MKTMFLAIELNLILWIALAGYLYAGVPDWGTLKKVVLAAAAFAAVVQHVAFHHLRRARMTHAQSS